MARTNLAKKLSLAVLSPLLVLLVLEAALYLAAFRHRPPKAPILIWNPVEDRALDNQESLFQSDPMTLWSPRPGARIPWGNAELVNPDGFRGARLPLERRPGVARIATMGDSSTFGMGVAQQDCYSAQLERLLNEQGLPVEILNAGVVGYTIRQGLERYRHHVRPYRPDVVVAAFGAVNEHHMALDLADDPKLARSQQSYGPLARKLMWARENLHVPQFLDYLALQIGGGVDGQRKRAMARQRRDLQLSQSTGQTNWQGTRRVSPGRHRELIAEFAREVEQDGARLVVLSMPREPRMETDLPVLLLYTESTERGAADAGVPLCDGRGAFRAAREQSDPPPALFVPNDAWHPNADGHGILARELAPLVRTALDEARSAPK